MNTLATSTNEITDNTNIHAYRHISIIPPRNSKTIINASIPHQISIITRDLNVTGDIMHIMADTQPITPSSSPITESQPETLHCPFPNCSYTTNTIHNKQNLINHYGGRHLKPRHTLNAPLYTCITGTNKVYCVNCRRNGKNKPILMKTLNYHLATCLPDSPFCTFR